MMGTSTSWLTRVSHTFNAIDSALKAQPPAGVLYPPSQGFTSYPINFPGWAITEARAGGQDEQRVKTALQSAWVFSNAQTIANEMASAELVIKEQKGEKSEDVLDHPLERRWRKPNPHMGRSFVSSYWAQSYTLVGKAALYWIPDSNGEFGENSEVWPIPPFMIKPVPDEKDFIQGYAFKASPTSKPIFIPPEYITYSHSVNLFDPREGLSALSSIMVAIQGDLAAARWNLNFFDDNSGIPDGMVIVPKDTLDQDLARIRIEIRSFFGGTKRGVAIARAGDLDYKPFGRSQKDMEFLQGREFSSKEIDRAFGFPEGYWSAQANRANAEQARATMIAGAVWPLLVRLSEDMNAQLMPRWFGSQYDAEFKDIRPEDRQIKLSESESHKSHWTIDELREADGKPPLGDVRGAMLIAELTKGTPIATSIPSNEMQEALAELAAEAGVPPEGEAEEEVPEEEAPAVAPEDTMETDEPIGEPPTEEAVPTKTIAIYPGIDGDQHYIAHSASMSDYERIELATADITRWEGKAIKARKLGKKGAVRFESEAIEEAMHQRISTALEGAETIIAVKAVFAALKATDDMDSEIEGAVAGAAEWATEAQGDE